MSARRMIVEIAPHLLVQFLKDGSGLVEVTANPLPPDARIVGVQMSFTRFAVQLLVESETFEEVEDGSHIPYLPSPTFKQMEPIEFVAKWVTSPN